MIKNYLNFNRVFRRYAEAAWMMYFKKFFYLFFSRPFFVVALAIIVSTCLLGHGILKIELFRLLILTSNRLPESFKSFLWPILEISFCNQVKHHFARKCIHSKVQHTKRKKVKENKLSSWGINSWNVFCNIY